MSRNWINRSWNENHKVKTIIICKGCCWSTADCTSRALFLPIRRKGLDGILSKPLAKPTGISRISLTRLTQIAGRFALERMANTNPSTSLQIKMDREGICCQRRHLLLQTVNLVIPLTLPMVLHLLYLCFLLFLQSIKRDIIKDLHLFLFLRESRGSKVIGENLGSVIV